MTFFSWNLLAFDFVQCFCFSDFLTLDIIYIKYRMAKTWKVSSLPNILHKVTIKLSVCKSDLYLVALLWKMFGNSGDPMSLRYPVIIELTFEMFFCIRAIRAGSVAAHQVNLLQMSARYIFVYMYIYISIHICVYVYRYIYIYIIIYMYMYTYLYVYICIYIYLYIYMFIYVDIYRYICIYMYMYTYTYVYTYICI